MTCLYNFLMLDVHCHPDVDLKTSLESTDLGHQLFEDLGEDASGMDEMKTGKPVELQNSRGYVPQSAKVLWCRVMPPPCLKNPYAKDALSFDSDPFSNQTSKCAGAVHCYEVAFLLNINHLV
ncbi:hypothetical protein C2S53_019960 [Perilla frutescens var. hirtella]|uniref:Uncharacterized protein n=1 Tax=Perilla frutescens var. hirtella TaxID=608512 RepID=A0AAD4ILW3_PERFH|nr:hypothetical protein C2S53_019960 [Perilla frutescens var. hirtella]